MDTTHSLYQRHRFSIEIISHCVWLYFRFCLSFRDSEEMMAKRGVVVSYESVREWRLKFGGAYVKRIGGIRANASIGYQSQIGCVRARPDRRYGVRTYDHPDKLRA